MTVRDLIAALHGMPQDALVGLYEWNRDPDDRYIVYVEEIIQDEDDGQPVVVLDL